MGKNRGNRSIITDVITKMKARIFDLIDAMSQRRMSDAIQIMDELIEMKEPVPLIMAMIGRQFSILLKTKSWKKKGATGGNGKVAGYYALLYGKDQKAGLQFFHGYFKSLTNKC